MKAFFRTANNKRIPIQFNPADYNIQTENATVGNDDNTTMKTVKREKLTMSLIFDTYMTDSNVKEDVRAYTDPIVNFSIGLDENKPYVTFIWGSLEFGGTVDSVSQKFTMFMPDGKPVRAELGITMTSIDRQATAPNPNIVDFSDASWKESFAEASVASLIALLKAGRQRK